MGLDHSPNIGVEYTFDITHMRLVKLLLNIIFHFSKCIIKWYTIFNKNIKYFFHIGMRKEICLKSNVVVFFKHIMICIRDKYPKLPHNQKIFVESSNPMDSMCEDKPFFIIISYAYC